MSLLSEHKAEIRVRAWVVRIHLENASELARRPVQLALTCEHGRQVRASFQMIGVAVERVFVGDGGVVQPPYASQHEAQVVVRECVVSAFQSAAKERLSLDVTPQVPETTADLAEHLSVFRHHVLVALEQLQRSEERRVGKECRSRWAPKNREKKDKMADPTKRREQATDELSIANM